ncbi:ankyrin repeat domain-containing protein 33B [Erpetoichthys calabaricus]|uniref:Ankyrin repeat domain 33B n=1 Tax=Erpetoichthys calabaricus TaxID=27687 RepID=A0A8C4X5N0_ERPCA|nr:ankyrin repeat domain-containing protein 33B [Erpetoichthys calabaricus]
MVLITDDREAGVAAPVKLSRQLQPDKGGGDGKAIPGIGEAPLLVESQAYELSEPTSSEDGEDDEEYEEYDDFSELPDTRSIASEDSFYPPDTFSLSDEDRASSLESPETLSFFQACCGNNCLMVKVMMRQGLTEEEVRETDKNGRTGLLVACYLGYVDIVITLAQCPYIDVNWQDKEGNTALITAAQAGHITISNYLLNYYPGLDIEKRNVHGFTALMKAAMQGRSECVRTLMLAGADLDAKDPGRKLTPRGWALFTGRYETAYLMQRLIARPCPGQFCETYSAEWPQLKELVAKATAPKGCLQKISETICSAFTFKFPHEPEEEGVMDHMVRMTTSLSSPFVATACRTVCPGSPPCVGKRRFAVQEILKRQRIEQLKTQGPERLNNYKKLFQNSQVMLIPKKKDRRASLQPKSSLSSDMGSAAAPRRSSLLPLHLLRRSSVRPGMVVPKVRVCKAPLPTFQPERRRSNSSTKDSPYLQVPKWRYKEVKEERKKAEEEERKKAETASQKHKS